MLALTFFDYGWIKVLEMQFGQPYFLLDTPAGSVTNFPLLVLFFGHSSAYQIFIGLSEVICGILLWFRRTMLPGALLSLVIMGNIVAMNFAFDISVKLHSSLYFFIALYLILPDLPGLFKVMVGRAHRFIQRTVMSFKRLSRRRIIQIQTLTLLGILGYGFLAQLQHQNQTHQTYELTGAWEAADRYGSPYGWQRLFIETSGRPGGPVRTMTRLFSGEAEPGIAFISETDRRLRIVINGSTFSFSYELNEDVLTLTETEKARRVFNLYRKVYD